MKGNSNLKLHFCYPETTLNLDGSEMVDEIVNKIPEDSGIGFAGFQDKSDLNKYLLQKCFEVGFEKYKQLPKADIQKIEKTIAKVTKKCLKFFTGNSLNIFVFPWFTEKYDKDFDGVNGFAPYANTIHLFISPTKFTLKSIEETVAHELNHAIFLYYRDSASELTLLETFVFEGLAENFREEVVGGESSPWSKVLNENESKEALLSLEKSLNSKGDSIYQDVFFGGCGFKKWTGYSIGYKIIKSFRSTYSHKTWDEIMKMNAKEIFNSSPFAKKVGVQRTESLHP
jgi:uncharacterized protein YjaZ